MAQYVMSMLRVSKVVPPKRQIIKDISLSFFPGAKIGLLGLNGAGKSTVLRIMAGVEKEYDGEVQWQPNMSIGYLPQEPSSTRQDRPRRGRVRPRRGDGGQAEAGGRRLRRARRRLRQAGRTAGQVREHHRHQRRRHRNPARDRRRRPAPAALGRQDRPLSGGEKRRVALCKLLLSRPDMLLLDEPTNHLDAESVDWLEQFLCRFPGTVVAVTHDRYFLDNAAEWILELDRGHGIPGRATTPAGWSRRRPAWSRKPSRKAPA
jgi:sulfate-transporting ATPase